MTRLPQLVVAVVALSFAAAQGMAQTAPNYTIDATWPRALPADWITGQIFSVDCGRSSLRLKS